MDGSTDDIKEIEPNTKFMKKKQSDREHVAICNDDKNGARMVKGPRLSGSTVGEVSNKLA